MLKIDLFEDVGGCWRWRLVAANGEILASSEAYAKKGNAKRTAKKLVEAIRQSPGAKLVDAAA